jgi:hypothetical protein
LPPSFDRHGFDLVGGHPIGEHGIEVEGGGDRFRRLGAVAGDHDDAAHPRFARRLHRAERLRPELVAEQDGADGAALD